MGIENILMYYITYRIKLYMVFDWSKYKIYISIIDITCRSKKGCLGYLTNHGTGYEPYGIKDEG
jgi:hypothetical protein